ncbi:MAG: tetratricopeptide repeat protein [Candidatus Lokiarchaeota archaeon]|nr:tetratricopeptide repeat protein [Candidatus Lokiarchaeota archaeon]MBD3202191.1 tetratricopeptide repeat protein [Candidatus Lokiarchaeota archaeon]
MVERIMQDWLNKAWVHYIHDRYEEAFQCYVKALTISPNNIEALYGLGNIYKVKRNYTKAFELFEKVLAFSTDNEQAWNGKGATYNHMGDYQNAIKCHEKVLEINSTNINALYALGFIYRDLKNYKKAIEYFENVLAEQQGRKEEMGLNKLFSESKSTLYYLGNIYEEMENYEKAIMYYENALEMDPHDFNIWDKVGALYLKIGNDEKADYCFGRGKSKFFKDFFDHINRKVKKPKPKSTIELLKQGDEHYEKKNYNQAFRYYEKVIEFSSSNKEAWVKLGNTFCKLNNPEKAIECYEEALKLNPKSREILADLERVKKEVK